MFSDADVNKDGKVDINQFKKMIAEQKKNLGEDNEEDTVDAYVSLGGQADKGGIVDANKLIDIIKKKFEMTIDIEQLIAEIDKDGSGEIDYDEFKILLNGE